MPSNYIKSAVRNAIGLTIALGFAGCGQVDLQSLNKTDGASLNAICKTEPNFLANNIVKGISIFDVVGTYEGVMLASGAPRVLGQPQRTLASEVLQNGVPYSPGGNAQFAVSRSNLTDGASNASAYVTRSLWAGQTCGLTQTSVDERIANCAEVLGASAIYDGPSKGPGAESVWKLVSRTGEPSATSMGREVWRDERTGLLWSSLVSKAINWCKASGFNIIPGNPAQAVDDGAQCSTSSTHQNQTGLAISACYEDGETNFTNTDGSAIDGAGKAGLGFASAPKVSWRLPTKFDYLQADLDGIRFVFPDTTTGALEWMATSYSVNGRNAFTFDARTGLVGTSVRNSQTRAVRCVGR